MFTSRDFLTGCTGARGGVLAARPNPCGNDDSAGTDDLANAWPNSKSLVPIDVSLLIGLTPEIPMANADVSAGVPSA